MADFAVIFLASLLAAIFARTEGASIGFGKATGTMIVVSALFVCLLKIHGFYQPAELLVFRNQVRAVGLAWASVFILLAGAVGALDIGHEFPHGPTLLFAVLGFATLIIHRGVTKKLLVKGLSRRKFGGRNVVLITDQQSSPGNGMEQTLANLGLFVTETFALPPLGAGAGFRKRLSSRVVEYVRESNVEEIVVEADPNRWQELRSLVGDLRVLPFPILFVPIGAAAEIFRRPTRDLGSAVGVELQRGPLTLTEHGAKRTLDIIGAGMVLLLLAPLLAIAAIAIKIESPGPVLFRQQRCGFNGRSFAIRKFRTMFVLEDGPTIVQAGPTDRRVTRVGRWLRRTSVDELPQLLNVLDGSMSLVGPRPHALAHDNQFDKIVRNYAFRRRVKPGLTGWAQVHGCRGPTPTTTMIERRVEYDLWYVDNWSLMLDFTILIQTPIEVMRARNAY
ncbi:exopolysaccharide biosynthesis polyprenyl glycosylphosphotransferase [Rhodoblastus sp.]|uniref:exopolysaccharide biosynthesis polyprenyl glycosylphosphotransferase n=1 Tax=Rhodoblastus sp. TaxID=1962975 RepID=UPI0035B01E8F